MPLIIFFCLLLPELLPFSELSQSISFHKSWYRDDVTLIRKEKEKVKTHERSERKDFEQICRSESISCLFNSQHAIHKITSGFAGRKREKGKERNRWVTWHESGIDRSYLDFFTSPTRVRFDDRDKMRPVACPPIRHERRSTKYPPDFYPPSSPRPSRNTKGGGSDTLSPNKSVPKACDGISIGRRQV